jgi:DinB family protein
MEYMKLDPDQRAVLLKALSNMPGFLRDAFDGLTDDELRKPSPDGTPSPVEQVWHLADLEREGFEARIRLLLVESDPYLPDFKGAQVAAARNYRARSLAEGLAAFAAARERNLSALRAIEGPSWFRRGTQEGVGEVSLCDMPGFMAQHDAAHKKEIDAWKAARRP